MCNCNNRLKVRIGLRHVVEKIADLPSFGLIYTHEVLDI